MSKSIFVCLLVCLTLGSACARPQADAEFSTLGSGAVSGNGPATTGEGAPSDTTATSDGQRETADRSAPREGVVTESAELAKPSSLGSLEMACTIHRDTSFDLLREGLTFPLHYVGNNEISESSTNGGDSASDLANADGSTCPGGRADLSAYWFPTLMSGEGSKVKPLSVTVFWGRGEREPGEIEPPPTGLNYVAGDPSSVTPRPTTIVVWNCFNRGTQERRPGYGVDAVSTIPDCEPGEELLVSLRFPSCWDGKNLTSEANDHVAEAEARSAPGTTSEGGLISVGCPASHPVSIARLAYVISWEVGPDGTQGWWLPSDDLDGDSQPDVAGGTTLYGGAMVSWDVETAKIWTENCIVKPSHCFLGNLNNGTRLKP